MIQTLEENFPKYKDQLSKPVAVTIAYWLSIENRTAYTIAYHILQMVRNLGYLYPQDALVIEKILRKETQFVTSKNSKLVKGFNNDSDLVSEVPCEDCPSSVKKVAEIPPPFGNKPKTSKKGKTSNKVKTLEEVKIDTPSSIDEDRQREILKEYMDDMGIEYNKSIKKIDKLVDIIKEFSGGEPVSISTEGETITV